MLTSNVCRIQMSSALEAFLTEQGSGMHVVPQELLAPRQIRILDPKTVGNVPCTLKHHRGSCVPVVPFQQAKGLVADNVAQWEPQKALVYGISDYIADKDVQSDTVEQTRAMNAAANGETLVLVAIVGENRSPLAVCRNIVSGCQKPEKLVADAQGAMDAALVFLVE